MRSRYTSQTGTEAFYDEVDSSFSGQDAGFDETDGFSDANAGLGTTGFGGLGSNPAVLNPVATASSTGYKVGQGMRTDAAENLDGTTSDAFNQMAFSIEKVTVTAKSRALKAEYSLELAQDLKAIHGLNAEAELANILSTEILAESTAKLSEPSTRLLSKVLHKTPQLLVSSTSTLIQTVVGLLRSSRVFYSKSSATLTQSHKELVEERATSSCALLTLLQH
jgi:hypothetical protein